MPTIALDASGAVTATAAAGGHISTAGTVATTSFPDLMYCVVGWIDTGTASVVVTDNTPLTWFPRGPIHTMGNYHIQEWFAIASATLAAKTVTATFSAAVSGRSGIIVCGITNDLLNLPFDPMGGLPNFVTGAGTGTATYGFLTTRYATDLLLGAILLAPSEAITLGTGFALLGSVDCTSFRFAVEYKVVTTQELNLQVGWTFGAETYTALSLLDAAVDLAATPNNLTETVSGAGSVTSAYWQQ